MTHCAGMWAVELLPHLILGLLFSKGFPQIFPPCLESVLDSSPQGDITFRPSLLSGWPTGFHNLNPKYDLPPQCLLCISYYTGNQSRALLCRWSSQGHSRSWIPLSILLPCSSRPLDSGASVQISWTEKWNMCNALVLGCGVKKSPSAT